jgi:hypothetical protein
MQVKYFSSFFIIILIIIGTFKEGIHDGYVLKELCEHERRCCELLQTDSLKDFVPRYNGTVKDEEGKCKKEYFIK